MDVQPASLNQVLNAGDRWVEISADAGMVVDDLKRIDPSLGVRLNIDTPKPFFAVYCQPSDRETYLVFTVQAYQNRSGTWEGLDKRVVQRVERIAAEDYDYAGEVSKANQAAGEARDRARKDRLEADAYEGFRVLRQLVGRNCAHIAVPE